MNQFLMRRSPNILGSITQLSSGFDNLLNSFFEDDFFRDELAMSKSVSRLPKINVQEDKDKYSIEAAVAGVDKKDLSIQVIGNDLLLSYEKREERSEDNPYLLREISFRSFQRRIPFHVKVDEGSVKAKLDNGILKVTVNKVKAKQIEVKKVEIE